MLEKGSKLSFIDYKDDMLSVEHTTKFREMAFLDGKPCEELDTLLMSSYPRSGNTLLRAYLERIMGLVTGSDVDLNKNLNMALLDMGMAGEGLVDNRVWIVKTHYPERHGKTKFQAHRCILLVRNPLDCITSLFHMVATGSHEQSIVDSDFKKFEDIWTEFLETEISVWKDYHDFWIN